MGWWASGGGGSGRGKLRVVQSLLGDRIVQCIESGETSDQGLGLVKNRVPVQTLKFDCGVSIFLGENGGVISIRREIATEENAGDDGYIHRE